MSLDTVQSLSQLMCKLYPSHSFLGGSGDLFSSATEWTSSACEFSA